MIVFTAEEAELPISTGLSFKEANCSGKIFRYVATSTNEVLLWLVSPGKCQLRQRLRLVVRFLTGIQARAGALSEAVVAGRASI